jgi:hypothetical protein
MRALQGMITASGNGITYRMAGGPGQMPQAVVTGHVGTVAVQGRAMVSQIPYVTALGANMLVFSAYWAPTNRLAAQSSLLASIDRCYGPETGTVYQVYHDQVFSFALPVGWSVSDEGQDNIDLAGDNGRAYAGYLLTLFPTSEAGTTATSLLNTIFARLNLQVTSTISSIGGASSLAMEFLGQLKGNAMHGLVFLNYSIEGGMISGSMRLALATTDQWNSQNSGLIKVMTSIQHSMGQDEQQWQNLMQQWHQFDQTTQQFDDALNGVQEVRDPTTGQIYAAPYDTYQTEGPHGAGYYLDKGGIEQLLEPVNPQ